MKLKRFLGITSGILLLVVVVAGIVVGRFFWLGGAQEGLKPPAENASEAPKLVPADDTQKSQTAKLPDYNWPPKFVLPLTIQVEPPKAPEKLGQATPMAKKDELKK